MMVGMLLQLRPLAAGSLKCAGLWRRVSSKAAAVPVKPKKKFLNDPSLRVRVVPMLEDNYGDGCYC